MVTILLPIQANKFRPLMTMAHGSQYSVITMLYWCHRLVSVILLLLWPGCSMIQEFSSFVGSPSAPVGHMRQSVLDRLTPVIRKDFEQLSGSLYRDLLTSRKAV